MFGLSTLATRIAVVAIFVICVLGFLQVQSCQRERTQAAQSRVERGQTEALSSSAKDAIAAQGAAAARERASEELTRTNEKEIRNAEGADAEVHPAVRDAGLRSLCRRAAYRDSERCRLLAAGAR